MSAPAEPKNAATVILFRPAADRGFEVFMTRRPREMKFLGGAYVFPGGTVRREDYGAAVLRRCRGLTARDARRILGATLNPEFCLGHWVAAIRELFEEVGILLCAAADGAGQAADTGNDDGARFAAERAALIRGEIDFATFLQSSGLVCDLAKLAHFSHWQTPREFPMRFNTHFYLAALPPGQEPLPQSEEVTHSLWLAPERALLLCERGSLPVIFPTFACLRALADFDTLENLGAEYGMG